MALEGALAQVQVWGDSLAEVSVSASLLHGCAAFANRPSRWWLCRVLPYVLGSGAEAAEETCSLTLQAVWCAMRHCSSSEKFWPTGKVKNHTKLWLLFCLAVGSSSALDNWAVLCYTAVTVNCSTPAELVLWLHPVNSLVTCLGGCWWRVELQVGSQLLGYMVKEPNHLILRGVVVMVCWD